MGSDRADSSVAGSRSPGSFLRWCVYKVPGVMPTLHAILRRMQLVLLTYFRDPADADRIRQVYRQCKCELQPLEAYAILTLARALAGLEGDMAEVGMFQGGSGKLICAVKGAAPFWGFDTFEGLVDVGKDDTHWGTTFFRNGAYRANGETVRRYSGMVPVSPSRKATFLARLARQRTDGFPSSISTSIRTRARSRACGSSGRGSWIAA